MKKEISEIVVMAETSEPANWQYISDTWLRKIKIGRRTLISGAEFERLLSEGA